MTKTTQTQKDRDTSLQTKTGRQAGIETEAKRDRQKTHTILMRKWDETQTHSTEMEQIDRDMDTWT